MHLTFRLHLGRVQRPPKRYEFVHVRWLYYDYDQPGGWEQHRLDRLSYQACRNDQDILDAFDFVDPHDIIRATHLIPEFKAGKTQNFLPRVHSIAHDHEGGTDWSAYYVNRFVDRDMLMRYIGGGVGHYQHILGGVPVQPSDESDGDDENNAEDEDGDEGKDDSTVEYQACESENIDSNITEQEYDEVADFDGDREDEETDSAIEDYPESDDDIEF